jgi:hypothetical protein
MPVTSMTTCCVLPTLFPSWSPSVLPHLRILRISGGVGTQPPTPSAELSGMSRLQALQSLTLRLLLDGQGLATLLALPLLQHIDLSNSTLPEAEELDTASHRWNIRSHCRVLRLPRITTDRGRTTAARCFRRMLQRHSAALQTSTTLSVGTGCPGLQALELCDLASAATLRAAASISSLTRLNVGRLPKHSALLSLLSTLCTVRLPHLSAL